ncbi:MAG: hypothetical protein QOK40_1650, partial [Miltoncostaeaceae bacterium]|nr:hypothetical protein [Miltoncostaeaceae bacterium]
TIAGTYGLIKLWKKPGVPFPIKEAVKEAEKAEKPAPKAKKKK